MSPHQRLGQREFEIACGLPAGSLDERTKALLEKTPLLYTALDEAAQAAARAKVAEDIDRGFTVVGEHRASIWRDAWSSC